VAIATGVGFIASIFTPWGIVYGAALAIVGFIGWGWPRPPYREDLEEGPK
jgi:hypothetical protein